MFFARCRKIFVIFLFLSLCVSFIAGEGASEQIHFGDLPREEAEETAGTPLPERVEQDPTPEGSPAAVDFIKAHGNFKTKAERPAPTFELSSYYLPGASLDGPEGRFDELNYQAEALLALPLTRDNFLLLGGQSAVRDYKFDNRSGLDDERLYNFSLRLGAGYFFSEDFLLQFCLEPSIYSDLGGPPYSDDWKLWYSSGIAVYRASEDFFWKLGFKITDGVDWGIIPLGGFAWSFAHNWKLDVLAPLLIDLSYQPTESWDLHTAIELDVEEYTIRQSSEGEEFRQKNIKIQDLRWYLGSVRKFDHGISAFWRYGVAFGGNYDWGSRYENSMDPALFIQGGLGWSF